MLGAAARAACAPRLLVSLFLGAVSAVSALSQTDVPVADPTAPISVRANESQRWKEGGYLVWLLHGDCEIRQGSAVVHSNEAVLWVDSGDALEGIPSKVIAYLEDGIWMDLARPASARGANTGAAQTISRKSWLGRFETTKGVELDAPLAGPVPSLRPHIVQRSIDALGWHGDPFVRSAQFTAPVPTPLPPVAPRPSARSVSIRSRSSVPWQAKSFPGSTPDETIITISSGVQIVVGGIENVAGVESGAVTIEADRVVVWTTALAGLDLSGEKIQQAGGRYEFYLEGNIIFREGDRVIYSERMYYNVDTSQGTILNAEMLTPVPDYAGLVRLKADVLQQASRQDFLAFGGAVTSSRMGVPGYWFQSEAVTLQDIQRPRVDPFTGMAALDVNTNEARVDHRLLATSRNNFLYVGGHPVLYWPSMATDLTRPSYYIDRVQLGNDGVFGTQVMLDFDNYQLLGVRNPPEGTKWTTSTDWLSDRGFGLGSNFRYDRFGILGIPGPAKGFLDSWGLHEQGMDNLGADRRALFPETDIRGRVFGQHRQTLAQGLQFSAEVGWISDRNFLEQYYEQEWDELKDQVTGVELKQYVGHSAWSIAGDVRLNEFFTQTEWLPRFDHYLLGQSLLFDRLTWSAHSQVGYAHLQIADPPSPINPTEVAVFDPLAWEVEAEGLRAVTRQGLDLPLILGPLKVTPYVLGEVGYWGEDLTLNDVTRLYGQAGVRTALPWWRADPSVQSVLFNLNGLAHKVQLDADVFYADANRDLGSFPLYDPLDDDASEAFRRRFHFTTFGGVAGGNVALAFDERYFALRRGMQNWVTAPSTEIADDLLRARVGLRQRWQTKRGLPGQERIVDWIVFDVEGVVFPEADRDNFGEPVGLVDYAFRWHLGDRLTLLSDGFADFFADGLKTVSVGALMSRPERGSLYAGFRSLEGPISCNLLEGSVAYRMSNKWVLTANGVVDLGDTGNIGQSLAVTRIGESLMVRVGFHFDASRDNFGLNLSVEPRFLPKTRLGRIGGIQVPPAGAYGLE